MVKRKAGDAEVEETGQGQLAKLVANPEKRLRRGQPRGASASRPGSAQEAPVTSGVRGGSSSELLEDMGVKLLSSSSPLILPPTKQNVANVLQAKDPNIVDRDAVTDGGKAVAKVGPAGNEILWDHNLECSYLAVEAGDGSSSYLLPSETPGGKTRLSQVYSLPRDLSVSEDFSYQRGSLASRSSGRGRDLFNCMSEEVVLSVFSWLPKSTLARCARVCKRWLRLSADETLWRRLDLGLVTVPAGVVGRVLARGCNILRLARATVAAPIFLSPFTDQVTFPLPGMEPDCARLQYLDLSMTSLEPGCLSALLRSCRQLKNLALENCSLNASAVEAMARNTGLQVLHLGGTQGLTPPLVTLLLDACPSIQELNLGWTNLGLEGVAAVVGGLSPLVERLCLSGNRENLLDFHMGIIGDRCPNLKELDVSDATKLTSLSLTVLVEKLPLLESLSTSRCYGIAPSSYLYLTSCASLLYLNLFGVLREQAMEELVTRLKDIGINKFMFTAVARPTVGIKRTSIWNLRVRD